MCLRMLIVLTREKSNPLLHTSQDAFLKFHQLRGTHFSKKGKTKQKLSRHKEQNRINNNCA